jgi:arrestin-related trafficking adapter 3/6
MHAPRFLSLYVLPSDMRVLTISQIVMRISKPDPADLSKRRHFEISIDSPFTVLNCRATQANTSLPEYSGSDSFPSSHTHTSCGCSDATVLSGGIDTSLDSSRGTLLHLQPSSTERLSARPAVAHLSTSMTGAVGTPSILPQPILMDALGVIQSRPIHLMRVPSYNPPAFDADEPPPTAGTMNPITSAEPIMTPPPQYDLIIGTPSVDGMADYFTRLANYRLNDDDESDSGEDGPARIIERSGRVNVANPRTPGGRRGPSRSLEIQRPSLQLSLNQLSVATVDPQTPTA